jgi:hypothetical protein
VTTGPRPDRRGPSLLLVIGLAVLVVLLVVAGVLAVALPLLLRGPVNQRYVVEGAPTVVVAVPNARLELGPSSDGRVHVQVSGWAVGPPRITVRTDGGATTVRGDCPRVAWFDACDIRLVVAMPPTADLAVTGGNGDISAHGLQGAITAETTNGAVDVRGARGDLTLHSTNGEVRLSDSASSSVRAGTTNGEIGLTFTDAPSSVLARSTNGSVTVTVPDTTAYAVTAHTMNGSLDTSSIRTDPASAHRIDAQTTNGSVQIRPSAG